MASRSVGPEHLLLGLLRMKESPVKQPAGTGNSAGKTDPALWDTILKKVQSKDIQGWSILSQGNLSSRGDNHYYWQSKAKAGEQLFISSLNRPDRSAVICDCIREVTGKDCTFTAVSADAVPEDDGSDEAYLKTIYETFGKEPVNVVDDIK